jgi:hypothetical protein
VRRLHDLCDLFDDVRMLGRDVLYFPDVLLQVV